MLVIVVDYNGKIQTIIVTMCLELNHQLLCITLNSNVDSIHTGHILHGEEMTYTSSKVLTSSGLNKPFISSSIYQISVDTHNVKQSTPAMVFHPDSAYTVLIYF